MRILAADIGFGYTKATDGRQFQVFKSIVGEANPIQFAESLLPSQAAQPRHFSIGGEDIFIGELAETQSRGFGMGIVAIGQLRRRIRPTGEPPSR